MELESGVGVFSWSWRVEFFLKELQCLGDGHCHYLDDRLAGDGRSARLGPQARAVAVGASAEALVCLELRAHLVVLRFVEAALERRENTLERTVDATPRENKIVFEAVHKPVAELRGQLLVGRRELHLVLLRDVCEELLVVEDVHLPHATPGVYRLLERKRLVGHDEIFVEVVELPKPCARRACAERRVERKRPRLQLVKRNAAVRAGVQFTVCELIV